MTDLKDWFIQTHDQYVNNEGAEPSTPEKSRDNAAHAYMAGVESGGLLPEVPDLISEGRALFDRYVMRERDRRRESIRRSAEDVLDAFERSTAMSEMDPLLSLAYPLGDGTDKALRYWTREDWEAASIERFRNAASATAAADEFDRLAQRVIYALTNQGAATVGALFPEPK